jgi:hypothetical protein
VKQTIVTGDLTYDMLAEGLNLSSDFEILVALERESLELRYELGSTASPAS